MQYVTTRSFASVRRQYETGEIIDPSLVTAAEWLRGMESGAIVPARFVGTAAEVAARGTPGPGVVVYETDTKQIKIGDGSTAPSSLPVAGTDTFLTRAENLTGLADVATARTALGLASAATMTPTQIAADSAFTDTYTPLIGAPTRRREFPDPVNVQTLYAGAAPVITTTAQATSTIANAALVACNDGRFLYRGAGDFVFGASFPDTLMYLPTSKYPHTYASAQSVWSVEFGTDASVFEIYFKYISSAVMWRLRVDGRRVTELPQSTGGTSVGGRHVLKVDLGSAAPRRITLEFYTVPFGGIYLPPTATLWRPSELKTRWTAFGDSLSAGSAMNTGNAQGTWIQRFADLMGWDDPWAQSIGGTGYITPGTAATLVDRVSADVVDYSPSKVIVWAGYNDSSGVQADIAAAAGTVFSTLTTGLPLAEIYVIGCWSPSGSPTAALTNTDTTLRTAAAAAGLPFISPLTGAIYNAAGTLVATTGGWITGTGKAGATTGSGNADLYIGSDGVHPNDSGHAYLARRIYGAIAALIAA